MKRILNYPGSKWRMADLIINNMPEHKSYLEPFLGSGAVFFSKPKKVLETINDIDGRLVNFFKVTRDQPEKLQYMINQTLYSREEYEKSIEISQDPVEDARRMAVRLWFGVGGKTNAVPGFRKNISWNGPYTAYEWNDMPNRIADASRRLKDAQIENMDAIKLIQQHNDTDTLIYCDPPYMPSSLVDKHYLHGYTEADHLDLLEALVNHKGKVMLSGYPSELYEEILTDWFILRQSTKVGITTEKKSDRTELVWCNFEPSGQMNLFG
ncbi:DNA methyltransferase [Enterococcus villorum]|uniref:site-specific DNA-methyltransferase (adenine-specific) n=1 Tax=Enterococcus villorum TaxID=112904 RepID=A0A1V8Y725_9ENTE|nr:DNA adenine methylase [Enterococcus villorum]OQO68413.1 DNA methyltransferase [Enterococcus villorum]OQO74360.1 DNA methyltransferase [Enterococcus villorum]